MKDALPFKLCYASQPAASMSVLSIRLFGELSIVDHRGEAVIGSRRTLALIAWLAMHLEDPAPLQGFVSRFGENPATLARELLYALRAVADDVLLGEGDELRLDRNAVDIDALRFDSLITSTSIKAVAAAAEIYRGSLLDGFVSGVPGFDEWVAEQRLRYWRSAVGTLGKLLAAQVKAGWWESAVDTASRLLSLDPTQEVVHRTLMRLQLEQGRPDSALRRYQECADILRREFQREPSAETEKVRDEIIAALERAPAPRDVFLKPLDRPVLILVVEDDAVSSALIEAFLQEARYEVVAVRDGADALLEIGRREFDLLVLDINVPTVNGLQLFEIMIQKGMDTPAVFVTGIPGPEIEARSLEIGAADFLRKPIRKEVLLPKVRSILQRRERARHAK